MNKTRVQFGQFELRVGSYELRRGGTAIKLERIPMELLILLVENRGELVSREMIVDRLWGSEAFLETEHSINTAINKLRAVLRDQPKQPVFIQTVIGKGYRFIAEVLVVEPTPDEPSLHTAESAGSPDPALTAPPSPDNASSPSLTEAVASANPEDTSAHFGKVSGPPIGTATDVSSVKAGSRWRAVVIIACAIVVFAPIFVYVRHENGPPKAQEVAPRFQSVAVLPFLDLSPDSGKQYLVDGMTDELITLLAQDTSIRVISRTSTMQYRGAKKPLVEIGAALHVDAVVEGSVLRSGNTVRVTAQLLDARRDQHLWAQTYEEGRGDPLAEQDKVTTDIALHVAEQLTDQPPAIDRQAVNPQARDLFLRGGYFWHQRTLDGLTKAIDYYNQAIQADPKFAAAYAALGEAYVLLSSYGGPGPSKPLLQARAAAEKALELNNRLGDAHTVLAAVKVDLDWDWNGAEQEFRKALELNPNDSTAHHWFALHLARMGRYPEAEVEMQRALELDPISVILQTDAAELAYYARMPEEARKRLSRALELDADFAEAHLVLGKIYEQQGDLPSAVAELRRSAQLFANSPNIEALLGHALALSGQRQQAEQIASRLEAESRQRYVSGVDVAIVYCGLGDRDRAMSWLERGFRIHDKGMNILATEPLFDGCRSDPRFLDLVRRMKLR